MAELFDITHDADNLDEYDATVTDGGDLSTGTPGLGGTMAKMECLIDDTNAIYGYVLQSPPASNKIRLRFYIDTNGLAMDEDEGVYVLRINTNDAPWYALAVQLAYNAIQGGYYLFAWAMDDEGNWDKWLGGYPITDAEHYVEIYIVRESSDGADDGVFQMWVDGVLKGTLNTVDNWTVFADMWAVYFGGLSFGGTPLGTFYLDELVANSDGSEIGPVFDIVTGAAAISGAGALSAAALLQIPGVAALSGTGALTADALLQVLGATVLSGTGALSADPLVIVLGDTILQGLGALEAIASLQVLGAVGLSGSGALEVAAHLIVLAAAALSGTGSLTAAGFIVAVTPSSRIFVVEAEGRTFVVEG